MTAWTYALIALGSALGGLGRYWVSGMVAEHIGETIPLGTLAVNALGSFAIGFFATLTAPDGRLFASPDMRQFFMYGLCGGFTTFSSFSLQTFALIQDGEWLRATTYAVSSLLLCMVAVWLGHITAASLNQLKGV